jgi:RNA polymerase sigma factor (sigma-70 family)
VEKFERIYRRYREAVFRFSMHCAGRADVAEDIASEVFLELHKHIERIDETQLPAWLFAVARNRAADYWLRNRTEHKFLQGAARAQPVWSVTGNLPDGLTLNATTVVISGIPSRAGTFSFTVNARDRAGRIESRS